jgi:murein DD-endopeptidase MepM/ murein hydrolase activator NlpD
MKKWKTGIALFIFAALIISVQPFHSLADTASDLQAKISAQNAAIEKLNAEIAGYQSQLTKIGADKVTLSNAIKTLTLQSSKLKADIQVTQNKISANNIEIVALGNSITEATANIDDLETTVAKGLREQNEQDNNSLGSLIVARSNFADLWQYQSQQMTFRNSLRDKVGQLASTRTALTTSKTKVEIAKKSLVTLAAQLQDQRLITQKNTADKNTLLSETKNQEAAYQKLVANKVALKNQMEADERDYESKLKFALNPNTLPAAGSSPLAWPLDKIVITQLFGRTSDAGRLYASGTHNGVDFGVSTGTPVRAMASGVIVGTGNTDLTCPKASYGMWMYIKYDNGLSSLYGHLSLIKGDMVAGTRVDTGTIVAYSGSTGYATGPHLHLTIIAAAAGTIQSFPSKACNGRNYTAPVAALNAYLDPMLYLPKK